MELFCRVFIANGKSGMKWKRGRRGESYYCVCVCVCCYKRILMVGRERRNRIVKDRVLKNWLNASYYAPSIPSRRFIHKSYYLLLLVATIGLGLRQSLFVLHIKAATRALRNNNHYQLIDGERKVFENENEKRKENKSIGRRQWRWKERIKRERFRESERVREE